MEQSELLVLHHEPLGEQGVLLHGYSPTHGFLALQSYDLPLRERRDLYPLSLLDIIFLPATDASRLATLLRIEDALPQPRLQTDLVRLCLSLFIANMLGQILPNYPPDPEMGQFIRYTLGLLSTQEKGLAYFPHHFLLDLSVLFGFAPRGTYTPQTPYFDLASGNFIPNTTLERKSMLSSEASQACALLLQQDYAHPHLQTLDQVQRNELLRNLVNYLALHLEIPLSTQCIDTLHAMLH